MTVPIGPATPAAEPRAHLLDRHLIRWCLVAFLLTFITARICVFLIMSRRMPDLYLYAGQTHVHHLNYGIFLLVGLTAYLLFVPRARPTAPAAVIYGIALGLTFDEFGMWLHLGGGYWQWASFHACVVVAALLSLLAVAPSWQRIRAYHWITLLFLFAALAVFFWLLSDASRHYRRVVPRLMELEERAPQ